MNAQTDLGVYEVKPYTGLLRARAGSGKILLPPTMSDSFYLWRGISSSDAEGEGGPPAQHPWPGISLQPLPRLLALREVPNKPAREGVGGKATSSAPHS